MQFLKDGYVRDVYTIVAIQIVWELSNKPDTYFISSFQVIYITYLKNFIKYYTNKCILTENLDEFSILFNTLFSIYKKNCHLILS
jgi:hypothetical protein